MSEKINPLVVDLSHWEWPCDCYAIKSAGYVGVIWKASQGSGYVDETYEVARQACEDAGLLWGAYHFADASDVTAQAMNFLTAAQVQETDLFCLDWEPNGDNTMDVDQARSWIITVETVLDRPGECVLYSGNQAKESISGRDEFFGARRLWLAHYSSNPSWQESWEDYWLWQYTDGTSGPTPHTVNGVDGGCDLNSYAGNAADLADSWASGMVGPRPSPKPVTTIAVIAPPNVKVVVFQPRTQKEDTHQRGMRGMKRDS